ncbi:hypothetical protein MDOR_29480 [Mycolicibacterium doricum]|uniref:Uncharacterized protein n=1 Tax=Mycolicibacterium doricum TaxID=126673 RepID=A0A7I7VU05_9MYCO|nr:hypothetical protein MDOR_29480 [Mycolicibacterium doricum]
MPNVFPRRASGYRRDEQLTIDRAAVRPAGYVDIFGASLGRPGVPLRPLGLRRYPAAGVAPVTGSDFPGRLQLLEGRVMVHQEDATMVAPTPTSMFARRAKIGAKAVSRLRSVYSQPVPLPSRSSP